MVRSTRARGRQLRAGGIIAVGRRFGRCRLGRSWAGAILGRTSVELAALAAEPASEGKRKPAIAALHETRCRGEQDQY
jgi:hypothetical protein